MAWDVDLKVLLDWILSIDLTNQLGVIMRYYYLVTNLFCCQNKLKKWMMKGMKIWNYERYETVKVWNCEGTKMWRYKDVEVWKCVGNSIWCKCMKYKNEKYDYDFDRNN